jgi:hypothetical protein
VIVFAVAAIDRGPFAAAGQFVAPRLASLVGSGGVSGEGDQLDRQAARRLRHFDAFFSVRGLGPSTGGTA